MTFFISFLPEPGTPVSKISSEEKYNIWKKEVVEKLTKIQNNPKTKENKFYYANNKWGGLFKYHDSRDLTATVYLWWLDHPSGDAPYFDLKDIIVELGDLYDPSISIRGNL